MTAPADRIPNPAPTALRPDGARTWHCEFTAGALRVLAQNQPALVKRCLARDPTELVAYAMARAAEPAGLGEAQWRACASTVEARPAALLPEAWILAMPRPIAAPESHFAVLLVRGERCDYYTLDHAHEGGTVLRHWDLLHGAREITRACPPDAEAVEDAILRHLGWSGATAAEAIARAAVAQPADARRAPVVDTGDLDRDNATVDRLAAILEAAYLDVERRDDRSLLVLENSVRCLVTLPAERKDHIGLTAAWTVRKDVPREARLEAANQLNNSYLAVRAVIDADGDVIVDLQLLLPAAVTPKYFVQVLRRFATISRDAVNGAFGPLLA